MNQQRLQADLRLIQELLTCPQGEEWILLKQHEELVDEDFIQIMEQVAAQLFREGDRQAAKFLHNWAAQLHHILLKEIPPSDTKADQSQAYLQLIQELIDCPTGEENTVLAQHPDLIGPGLVTTMHHVAQKMAAQGILDTAQYLESLASQISQAWIQEHLALGRSPTPSSPPLASPTPTTRISDTVQPDTSRFGIPQVRLDKQPMPTPDTSQKDTLPSEDYPQEPAAQSATTQAPDQIPDPWDSNAPVSSALRLKVPQQIANGLTDLSLMLHQVEKTLTAQTQVLQRLGEQVSVLSKSHTQTTTPPQNPLWYMDVLERACEQGWIVTTEDIEQLIGVKPKCHSDESTYERGYWTFKKVGKLGTQTAWRVHKSAVSSD